MTDENIENEAGTEAADTDAPEMTAENLASPDNTDSADTDTTAGEFVSGSGNDIRHEEPTGETAEIIAKSISGKNVNIDALLKVPVSLAIEVGRTKMNLSDLLDTQEGTVIELARHLDEPLDILVNGALIAHGIVVLANEKFGLQITDIISLEERARSL